MNQQLTNATTRTTTLRTLNTGTDNGAATAALRAPHADRALTALNLMQRLQTTLDASRLIEFFAEEAGRQLNLDGVEYVCEALAIDCRLGRQGRHCAAYRLSLGEEELGTLTFRRGRKFDAGELEQLEDLLCHLLYPLRNAVAHERALQAALRDPLTGLCNRTALGEALEQEVHRAHRYGHTLSLVMLDVDHFKQINDTHGHMAGDAALKAIAALIRETVRDTDLAFRFGGEEFVLLLNETPASGALIVAERLRQALARRPLRLSDGTELALTASLGVAELQADSNGHCLLEAADAAMYRAKRAGRNRVEQA